MKKIIEQQLIIGNPFFKNIEYDYLMFNKINYKKLYICLFKYFFYLYKKLIIFIIIFIIICLNIILSSYKYFDNINKTHINLKKDSIVTLTKNYNELKQNYYNIFTELDSLKASKNFKRFFVYQKTKVYIPENIDSFHLSLMEKYRIKYNIPINIYYNQIKQESNFKNNAISHKGAFGYCQLMPRTYKIYLNKLNLKNCVESQINIGAYYLYEGYLLSGSWEKALRRYNSGNLNGYNNETNNYISKILK